MAMGFFLFRQDKTTCGGKIIEGIDDHGHFGQPIACDGHAVTCGKHPGTYKISGGMGDFVHGREMAGTLHSVSTCPCKATFIHSSSVDSYEFTPEVKTSQTATIPPAPAAAYTEPEQNARTNNEYGDICKPEDNPLLNGVYIWTEITGTGHTFVSVHENNQIYLYSYGRYGRTGGPLNSVGDGILDFMQGEDARTYYRYELYGHNARVFLINDASIKKTRSFFEQAWREGKKPIKTDGDITARTGHTIDKYDVTGSNCTTHSVKGIEAAGSAVFSVTQKTHSQIPLDATEDFAIPVSLQKYLVSKSHDVSSMQVLEMTDEFKKQYPNIEKLQPIELKRFDKVEQSAAGAVSDLGNVSPYSGGSTNGLLGGIFDVKD